MYHYAGNNPVRYTDPDGRFAHIVGEIIAGVAVGATVGFISQAVMDLAVNGEISDFATYAAAIAGGAAGGAVLAVTKNKTFANAAAGAVGGMVGNATKQTVKLCNGEQEHFDFGDCFEDTIIGGTVGGILQGGKVKGITSGRNSFEAIGKSTATKLKNGIIKNASFKTGVKIGISRCISGTLIEGAFVAPVVKNEVEIQEEYFQNGVENAKKISELELQKKKFEYYKQLYGN